MKYDTAQQWGDQANPVLVLLGLRLEYLYTEFLLYTLLGPSSRISRESLITTAHEIVNLVLLPTRKRDLLHSHRADMEWTVSSKNPEKHPSTKVRKLTYIAAGVLCHALCKRSNLGTSATNPAS
jgi:hypothetical protein